jgi:hypothetical protein
MTDVKLESSSETTPATTTEAVAEPVIATEQETTASASVSDVESTESQTQSIVEAVLDLGAAWARYGLVVGKLALKTSAKTLESTANILGSLADEFERKAEQQKSDKNHSARAA